MTLTGAFDDHVAVTRGGCHITDNTGDPGTIVARVEVPAWHVAVWVPAASIDKALVRSVPAQSAAPAVRAALNRALDGDVATALSANHAAYFPLYAAAGLPVDDAPVQAALAAGAVAAGITGTGPAVAALFEAPHDLPPVRGGVWRWTRVRGAGA